MYYIFFLYFAGKMVMWLLCQSHENQKSFCSNIFDQHLGVYWGHLITLQYIFYFLLFVSIRKKSCQDLVVGYCVAFSTNSSLFLPWPIIHWHSCFTLNQFNTKCMKQFLFTLKVSPSDLAHIIISQCQGCLGVVA